MLAKRSISITEIFRVVDFINFFEKFMAINSQGRARIGSSFELVEAERVWKKVRRKGRKRVY